MHIDPHVNALSNRKSRHRALLGLADTQLSLNLKKVQTSIERLGLEPEQWIRGQVTVQVKNLWTARL